MTFFRQLRYPVAILSTLFLFALTMVTIVVLRGLWTGGLQAEQEAYQQFDRLRAIAAFKPELSQFGNGQTGALDGMFLGEGPPAVLSANLLDHLKQMAAMQGVEVLQAEGLPPKPDGALTLIGGNLQMSGSMPSVFALLKAIDETQPVLLVDRLVLRSNRTGGDEAASETYLSVELRVFGAVRHTPAEGGS